MHLKRGAIWKLLLGAAFLIAGIVVSVNQLGGALAEMSNLQEIGQRQQRTAKLLDQVPVFASGSQTDALEHEQLRQLDTEIDQTITNHPTLKRLLRANIALRLGEYQHARTLLRDDLSQVGLFLHGNADLMETWEALQGDEDVAVDRLLDLTDRAQEYFLLAARFPQQEMPATTIDQNYQLAQLLAYGIRIDQISKKFSALFELFDKVSAERKSLGELISTVMQGLKAWDLSDNEEAAECAAGIMSAGRAAQLDLVTAGERLNTYKSRARQLVAGCIDDPTACGAQLDSFFERVSQALEDISLGFGEFRRSYQRVLTAVEARDAEGLVALCAGGDAGSGEDGNGSIRQGLGALEELLGPGAQPEPGGQEELLPDELDELRGEYDEYIPAERDEQMIQRIQEREQIWWRQVQDAVTQPDYSYQELLDQLFIRFYGNTSGPNE